MKKFTGGLGDDDDRESGDEMVWQKYFTKVSKPYHGFYQFLMGEHGGLVVSLSYSRLRG